MYGQGNYAQFRPAPPNQPAPPVQPPAPGPPPRAIYHGPPFLTQSHQIPPRPLPPALAVPPSQNIPPPAPVNIGLSYGNILPPPYPPQPPTYSTSVPSHGTAHVPPPPSQGQALYQIPPPPSQGQALYQIPPPPSQGQALYQIPPPPPFANIQHVPIPHSQPPSYFPVTAAPFSYSGSVASGHDAQPPSLPPPPPPPPPSSPPPVPPSPPSVVFLGVDDVVVSSGSTPPILGGSSLEGAAIDARATSAKSTDNSYLDHTFHVGKHINVSKKIAGDDESSRNLLSTSPEPIKEVALQQCSVSLNSSKEDLPFEAISVDNDQRNSSPASSDMDMEDDDGGQLESVTGHNILKKEPVGVPTEVADEGGSRCASQSLPNTKEKFTSTNIPQSSSDYTDVSPVRSSPGDAECYEATEVPAVFIKAKSPFRLIQGYASDESEEKDGGDEIDVDSSMRASSLADLPTIHTDNKFELKFASPSIPQGTIEENLDRVEKNVEPSKDHDIVGTDGLDIDQLEKLQPEDARQDSDKPKLDEFGRLVREGVSDSDSDDMQYDDRHETRRGSSSHWSPHEGSRHRWNHSPRRRDNKNNSPRHSLVMPFRHANKFSRRDKEQRPECFNFVRGRCVHGASCRFLHPDFSRIKTMHKIHRDPSRQSSTFDVHGHASDQERDHSSSKKDNHEFDKLRQEGTEEIYTKHAESNINTTKYGDDKKVSPGSVIESGLLKQVHDDVKQEDTNQGFLDGRGFHLGTQKVRKLSETSNSSGGDREETLLESDNSKLVKNVAYQASPVALLEQTERVLQGSPASQSHEKQVMLNQISYECLNEKEVQVSKFSAPDNSQLQSHIQEHTSFAIPTVNMSPLASRQHTPSQTTAIVSQLQPSESDMLLPGQHQIASEQYAQNIHAPNVISSNFHMPTISQGNELTTRTSISTMEHPQLHQQNVFPPRNDFAHPSSMPNFGWEFSRPQSIDFNYHPLYHTESSHQPPVHLDKYKHNFPMGVSQDLPFRGEAQILGQEGSEIFNAQQREYHIRHKSFVLGEIQIPSSGQIPSSFPHGSSVHLQSLPLAGESFPNAKSVPGDLLQSRLLTKQEYSSVKDLPYSNQHKSFAWQHDTGSRFPSAVSGHSLVDPSVQKVRPEDNLPPPISGITMPKMPISMHHNPFASTFEQGPSTIRLGYDVSDLGPRLKPSLPNFRSTEEQSSPNITGYALETSGVPPHFPRRFVREPTGDTLYDPLFDSIEPSSGTLKKLVHAQKQGQSSTDACSVLKFSSLSRAEDVPHYEDRRVGAIELKSVVDDSTEAATDAEVGVVENDSPQLIDGPDWSPDNAAELANTGAGEIEIDQVHSPGKKAKSKELRSMKLFKIALAEFVKEVLKPSWRQGNMSKEAFKTIVKKTVDKVSRSVPTRQIPKTQAKINQYVESSQRKLTKLVMGYVDKYVKM
ncbi:uncharacterized protein LOC122011973 [Zingiber officinale]|uniref:uncharacterized protein LOC122011973 n=1 Tax=Zingiber officinale TaxID=94328 RepID=UPI001C4CB252|nr:uncharacterized protein LOC122011973 [Zingiber officinale]XP_042424352.1 uncharacterized protein LOC122011973 [Zingiber officinale]XP_042424353.1 uncharacterized protein LOC122011973 [Zingiber officinale]